MTPSAKQAIFLFSTLGTAFLAVGVTAAAVWGNWTPLVGFGMGGLVILGVVGLNALAERLFPDTPKQERQ